MRHDQSLSVALTHRQKEALRDYTGALGVAMGTYVRDLVRESIPSEYWQREPAPKGQLSFDEEES